ncbi:glycine cleavage system H protein [Streptoalloteichus tenebrarius]|uniref:Glycine cleavage system H protein n=1 Tax=Streptoalloteichus tenebrarius (strain ATCC 17920 / DSM 40477 / JCM 4838 / CBS 697.72 / NBRC 16177 / NCIMB 11028 / NRRL B-12390 / A12253. 1 / ISP 5477) TaxID=1933 RepID=A0ABT1HQR8_STRSD|nr:glycine cleavage system H protein [Streptoalloteichus tenebrarius]BFE99784.1 glycine cleavage system protein GcvH [Streptoalloteichus tenebrarius]
MVPEELRYTEQHEWVARAGDDTVRVGITDYAQRQLGDVVFVQLPEVGRQVAEGDSVGEVESTKSVSDIYAPLAGEVVAVNEAVVTAPETINGDPYGDGWLVELRISDPASVDGLLDAAGYREKIGEV